MSNGSLCGVVVKFFISTECFKICTAQANKKPRTHLSKKHSEGKEIALAEGADMEQRREDMRWKGKCSRDYLHT